MQMNAETSFLMPIIYLFASAMPPPTETIPAVSSELTDLHPSCQDTPAP